MGHIRKGDEVVVIAGRDKGRRGTVLRVQPDNRVLVEGVNVVKKHQRPNPGQGVQGGIIQKEMPVHLSNVMIYNPVTKKGDRVGHRYLEETGGKHGGQHKVRYFKSNGEVVDV
jgi:large subunit ribosomal protein L24